MIYDIQKGSLKKRINIQELEFKRKKKGGGSREKGKEPVRRMQRENKGSVYGYSQSVQPSATSCYPSKVHLLTKT